MLKNAIDMAFNRGLELREDARDKVLNCIENAQVDVFRGQVTVSVTVPRFTWNVASFSFAELNIDGLTVNENLDVESVRLIYTKKV